MMRWPADFPGKHDPMPPRRPVTAPRRGDRSGALR